VRAWGLSSVFSEVWVWVGVGVGVGVWARMAAWCMLGGQPEASSFGNEPFEMVVIVVTD
jgi:hypothetical protein